METRSPSAEVQNPGTERPAPATTPATTPATAPAARRSRAHLVVDLVWLATAVTDCFLGLSFLLLALAAAADGFSITVERVAAHLAVPFQGMVPANAPAAGRTTDWKLLLALVVYTLGAYLVTRVLILLGRLVTPGPRTA